MADRFHLREVELEEVGGEEDEERTGSAENGDAGVLASRGGEGALGEGDGLASGEHSGDDE